MTVSVFYTVEELRTILRDRGRPLGLVPTMGGIHEGHVALLKKAKKECASVVASIFINPGQFDRLTDLDAYPRDLDRDLRIMDEEGVDIVFTPAIQEMYPSNFDTVVKVDSLSSRLEGASRPGHLQWMSTIVCKLLSIVQPDRAYFGQKDAQQLLIVQRMVEDLNLGAEIVAVPTVREADGLAFSSRNSQLTPESRVAALGLYAALQKANRLSRAGETNAEVMKEAMRIEMESRGATVDYVSISKAKTLEELAVVEGGALALVAGFVSGTRLIDNLAL